MPDFFYGEPLPMMVFPPDSDEKKKTVGEFIAGKGDIATNVGKLVEVVKAGKGQYTSVEGWGAYGLCWGGKVGFTHASCLYH